MLRRAHKLRSLVPQAARERLYEWHPGRAKRWRRYPGLERVESAGQAVLTFDDGPDEDATPDVLNALDEAGVRATFFVLAQQLHDYPEIAHDVVRRGHEIGLHGHGHMRHDRIDAEESRDDILRGYAAIEDVLGLRPLWYRPPYGKMSNASAQACRELGVTPVYWSAWGVDWEPVSSERIVDVASDQLTDGGILLLHDSARFARRPSARPTAQAIAPIAAWARGHGISLVPVGEAVGSDARV